MSNLSALNGQRYFGGENSTFAKSNTVGLTTFVSPASNTNGVLLHAYNIRGGYNAPKLSLMTATSAPVSESEPIIAGNYTSTIVYYSHSNIALPFYIPKGRGLYLYMDSNSNGAVVSVCYEVL